MLSVKEDTKTRVICIGNQKGGVGKTTNTINLAAALAERGRTSLIIDLDPSAGATKNLGAPTTGWVNAFDLLTGADPEDCILTSEDDGITLPKGIHLVPGTETLGTLGQWLSQPQNVFRPLPALLVEPIRTLRGRYDYIWFDTPPTHTHQTTPALTIADYAIVSTKPEARSVDAIGPAVRYIMRAKEQANPKLRLLGIILNAMPGSKTRLASTLVDEVEQFAAGLEFRPYLRSKVSVLEAEKAAQTIFDYEPSGETADQYRALAVEIEERIERFEAETETETETEDLPTREIVPVAARNGDREAEKPAQTVLDYEGSDEPGDEKGDPQPELAEQPEEQSERSEAETETETESEAVTVAVCETKVADPEVLPSEAEEAVPETPDPEPSDEPAEEQADSQREPAEEAEVRTERSEPEAAEPETRETTPAEPELEPRSWMTRIRAALLRWLSGAARFLRR